MSTSSNTFVNRRGDSLPHARYGIDLSKVPDTYIEPFTAYRAWNWTEEGVVSLNGEPWTPKQAFEAKCLYADRQRSLKAAAVKTPEAQEFWDRHQHHVPDPTCTCGMYAGISMRHMIDIGYIGRGIHGEVSLWGRLMRHTLGWRAQYAYPRYFVVPTNMIPVKAEESQERLAKLVEFDVDIYLQPEREARIGQERIPLWVKDSGYSTQGIEFLVERWKKWDSAKIVHTLAAGDRLAVFSDVNGGGIGVVKEIKGEELYYTLFAPNVVYRKKLKDIVWNERNWRWETTGLGMMRKLERETTPRSVPR
ncbi:MAG: hypothetical protein ACRELF_17130 [Gemmataceae bacterium]